ncbi:MAG: cobyrinate a,c-diamide synthase [Eubacteriales bacterium]|nr:cobyrinate a,c-diamide synthase [Eubacteriales bacterium]
MEQKMPRILFAAPKSGSGKTMITCGMIEALKRRKFRVASLKCGPDYIDPMFHRQVLGIEAGNLDTFFTDEETARYLLEQKAKKADITVLEGVMGFYDGLGGQSERASTYEAARVTKTPVVLIVDAKGASVSLAALIKGMLAYRPDHNICGVLLNQVSPSYYERLKNLIEAECSVPVLGFLPVLKDLAVPSRHLGLVSPAELKDFEEWAGQIADAMEAHVDLDALIALADAAPECAGKAPEIPVLARPVRLAVARDEAFSFYYTENLELLSRMGAELVYFSPLYDDALPEKIDGLLLGGGYPENYVRELEKNEKMRAAVRAAVKGGLPCLAECGGFLYLQRTLEGADGFVGEMAGALEGEGFRTKKLTRFGYMEAQVQTPGVLGGRGERIRGHEFHYWDCTANGDGFWAQKPLSDKAYSCMVHTDTLAAGFPHFYYYSNPDMIFSFLQKALTYQSGRLSKEYWDSIAKPIDSLGLLEDQVVKLSRIAMDPAPYDLSKRALVIFCGDHGVVCEGVTQTDSGVTRIVAENFAKGCSSVNFMAKSAGADVYTIDIGTYGEAYPCRELTMGKVIDRKIAAGCGNIAREAAMTKQQCKKALETGIELAGRLKEMGYRILATGEMGIGNTTPTSALAAALLKLPAKDVTGKGAGLSAQGIAKKVRAVQRAADRVLEKNLTDPFEILAEIGCYEIAGMAGLFLGGMKYRIPVVIDGAISSIAALVAYRMDQRAADFMLASHESAEIAGKLALKEMGLEAVLHGRMCLGEGSGAVALLPLLDMAMAVYRNMGTFSEYRIEAYERFE